MNKKRIKINAWRCWTTSEQANDSMKRFWHYKVVPSLVTSFVLVTNMYSSTMSFPTLRASPNFRWVEKNIVICFQVTCSYVWKLLFHCFITVWYNSKPDTTARGWVGDVSSSSAVQSSQDLHDPRSTWNGQDDDDSCNCWTHFAAGYQLLLITLKK